VSVPTEAVGRVPGEPAGTFGRTHFQPMSNHDTPAGPLPSMRFIFPKPELSACPVNWTAYG
jgi:hypothetical protein